MNSDYRLKSFKCPTHKKERIIRYNSLINPNIKQQFCAECLMDMNKIDRKIMLSEDDLIQQIFAKRNKNEDIQNSIYAFLKNKDEILSNLHSKFAKSKEIAQRFFDEVLRSFQAELDSYQQQIYQKLDSELHKLQKLYIELEQTFQKEVLNKQEESGFSYSSFTEDQSILQLNQSETIDELSNKIQELLASADEKSVKSTNNFSEPLKKIDEQRISLNKITKKFEDFELIRDQQSTELLKDFKNIHNNLFQQNIIDRIVFVPSEKVQGNKLKSAVVLAMKAMKKKEMFQKLIDDKMG